MTLEPIAHGVEPRPEVGVKMYDLVANIQTQIVEVWRLYDDADLVRGMSWWTKRHRIEHETHPFLLFEINI